MGYIVYLLKCSDGTFYTGITTDLARRLKEHNGSSKGAAYTRTRRPVLVVYEEACGSRSDALKREHAIRTLPRMRKELLANAAAGR